MVGRDGLGLKRGGVKWVTEIAELKYIRIDRGETAKIKPAG